MNRIRPSLPNESLLCSWPVPEKGRVLVEFLRCYVPTDVFTVQHRAGLAGVLRDYPHAGLKFATYVWREGLASTIAKTRAKIDQSRVRARGALSAVGTVADAPDVPGLEQGDLVACGGFQLPVSAEAYVLHPDQCVKLEADAEGLEMHFWLGGAIRLLERLSREVGGSLSILGFGPMQEPLERWCATRGIGTRPPGGAQIAAVSSSWWLHRSTDVLPTPKGVVFDPFGVCVGLPEGWRSFGRVEVDGFRSSPLDRRTLDWPFPYEPSGRDEAIRVLSVHRRPRVTSDPSSKRPRRIDLPPLRSTGDYGISVVGCGNFARAVLLFHALREKGVALRGICDVRPEVAAVNAKSLGAAFHTASFEEILADERTHAVIVTSDHGSHAGYVASALTAGKSVHVEKPPAVTPDQLLEIMGAAERSGRVLTIGYNRPFAPAFGPTMDALGRERGPTSVAMIVKGFKLPREHWYYWPEEGTRIAGNLVHWLDVGYRFAGRTPAASVTVIRDRTLHPADAADVMVTTIRFPGGSVVSVAFTSAGDDLRGVREWIEIARGGTTIRIDDFARLEILKDGRSARRHFGLDRGHAAEFRDVMRRLRSGIPDPETIRDMVATSGILFAAQRSFESGREEAVAPYPALARPPANSV